MARARQGDGRVHAVIVGCRRSDGRWLCIRRSDRVAAPLKVCFPGGGVEADEPQPTAVVREIREELGVMVEPMRCVWRWDATPELTLWGWTATCPGGELTPDAFEVADVMWLTAAEVAGHPDAMPSNRSFVTALERDAAARGRAE